MQTEINRIIDDCGGTTAVARLLKLAPSTVHSWRTIGVSQSRLDHLRLAATEAGLQVDFGTALSSEQVAA